MNCKIFFQRLQTKSFIHVACRRDTESGFIPLVIGMPAFAVGFCLIDKKWRNTLSHCKDSINQSDPFSSTILNKACISLPCFTEHLSSTSLPNCKAFFIGVPNIIIHNCEATFHLPETIEKVTKFLLAPVPVPDPC